MKVRRFASTAEPERPRFASPGQVLGFGLLASLALLAVFPGQGLERRLENSAYGDNTSLSYLRAWLRAKPDDHHLRLILARQQLQVDELAAAEQTLLGTLAAHEIHGYDRAEGELMLLEVRERQLWRSAPGQADYAARRAAYLAQLRRVTVYRWEGARLESFVNQAVALGDMPLARQLYQQLVSQHAYHSLSWMQRFAELDVADGRYQAAATVYFQALPYTQDLAQRREFFLRGLRVLQAGNRLPEALAAAQAHIGPLADDRATLLQLARLAQAANRLDLAEHYIARLLRQRVQADPAAPALEVQP